MTDITHTKIEVNASRLKYFLQAEWGPASAVKIRVVNRESSWAGEVTATADIELSKKLIQLVKDQPFLYDKTLEDYKFETKKTEAWAIIADCLNLSAEETQIRWTRLRIDFGRHRRKRQSAQECGAQIRNWPLYELLTWLAPHIKMRGKREKRKRDCVVKVKQESFGFKPILPRPDWHVNADIGLSVDVNPNIVIQNGHEDITESFIVSPDTADYDDETSLENSQLPYRKATYTGKDHSYSNGGQPGDSHSGQVLSSEEENEDNLFCRSISASLRRFSYRQKALAKIRIQQVMYEIEFEQAEEIPQVQS